MNEKLLECYFLVVKDNDRYKVFGFYEIEQDALKHKENLEKINISDCKILKGKEITNRNEIGFENNVRFNY